MRDSIAFAPGSGEAADAAPAGEHIGPAHVLERIERPIPMFGESARTFSSISHVTAAHEIPGGLGMAVVLSDGSPAEVAVSATRSGALRVRFGTPALGQDPLLGGAMLPGSAPRPAAPDSWSVSESAITLTLQAGGWRLVVQRDPFSWRWERLDGTVITDQRRDDFAVDQRASLPLGASSGSEGDRCHETLQLRHGERLFGLGQQYGRVEKRGQRIVQWNADAYGTNTTPVTYHNVPFCWSTCGYGIVVHTGGRVTWEMGWPSHDSLSIQVDGTELDLFLLSAAPGPDMLRAFYALAGAPARPPAWSFGVWMSRCTYRDRAEVEEAITRLDAMEFPVDVLNIDPAWLRNRKAAPFDVCDYVWDEDAFTTQSGLAAWLAERGVRLCLWENPYLARGGEAFERLRDAEALVRTPNDGYAGTTEEPDAAIVDYTAPEARAWSTREHARLIRDGARAFKTDYGESVPENGVFSDGRTGSSAHNLYPLLYNRTVWQAMVDAGVEPVLFARSGWLGSHRHPLHWSGDAQSSWEGLRGALRSGLSAALSGIAFWTCDIGGMYRPPDGLRGLPGVSTDLTSWPMPDGELYARWAWFGMLISHARFHGVPRREPYHFDERVATAVRTAALTRYRLLPEIVHAASQGLPVMRPLPLAYANDARAHQTDDQYMLGDNLLVAPVVEPGGQRTVYLPRGAWVDWWTRELHEGPADVAVEVALDSCPIYQRWHTTVQTASPARRVEEALAGPVHAVTAGPAST